MEIDLITLACERAAMLPKEHPVRVYAIATNKRGQILAERGNSYHKSHPIQKKWAMAVFQPEREFLHAEVSTLIAALKTGKKIDKLIIGRVDKQGNRKNGKPCIVCATMLEQEFPDVKIYWSKENDE